MRHILLALMIAMLPVRGWVGDAMALSMLAHPVVAAAQVCAQANCPDHATAPAQNGAVAQALAAEAPHDMSSQGDSPHPHSACDVCNGPAMAANRHSAEPLPQKHRLLSPLAVRFASTVPRQGIKPPIS